MDKYTSERQAVIDLYRKSGMSQQAFAAFCGISQAALSGVLHGTKGSRTTFMRIAKAHGMGYGDYFQQPEEVEQVASGADVTAVLLQRLIEDVSELKRRLAAHETSHHPQSGRPGNTAGRR